MSGRMVIAQNERLRERAPFNTFWGTDAPSGGTGSNGDYFFRYHDGTEAIYKKVSGSWVEVRGFTGFDSSNSQIFELTSNFSSVLITNFTITASSKLRIEKDGVSIYEGHGVTRNTGTNSIDFDGTISASAQSPVLVFVGAYS
jgi:hypothetical protein